MYNFGLNKKRKKFFGLFVLSAFSFAWLACSSHFSSTSPIVDSRTQSSHADHGDDSKTHTASCLDHTYQISVRNQGNSFSPDIDASVIPTPVFAFDFSRLSTISERSPFYRSDPSDSRYLFLEQTVLRL